MKNKMVYHWLVITKGTSPKALRGVKTIPDSTMKCKKESVFKKHVNMWCYGLHCIPTNSCVEVLIPGMTVCGGRKWIRLSEVIMVGPWYKRMNILRRWDSRELSLPRDGMARRPPSASQEAGSCQKMNHPIPRSWTCSLHNYEKQVSAL